MKTFRCGDVVPGCSESFVGTEDDILAQVAVHAREHGLTSVPPELVGQVRAAIRAA